MRESGQSLAEALRGRMGSRGQAEFAAWLGISQAHLSEILSGKARPGLERAAAAIARRYPDLLPFFVPEDIDISILPSTRRCAEAAARRGLAQEEAA